MFPGMFCFRQLPFLEVCQAEPILTFSAARVFGDLFLEIIQRAFQVARSKARRSPVQVIIQAYCVVFFTGEDAGVQFKECVGNLSQLALAEGANDFEVDSSRRRSNR